MILVLSNEEDITTDFVAEALNRDEFLRVNVERFAERAGLTYTYEGPRAEAVLRWGEQRIPLDRVTAVYSRRAGAPEPDKALEDPGVRAYARSEYQALVDGLLGRLRVPWMNHPLAVRRAESKILQLSEAARCGLATPRTIVTNEPERARRFVESCAGNVIIKALSRPRISLDGVEHVMFTTPLPQTDTALLDDLSFAPCIIQAQVAKACDVRVTVVAAEAIAVEIESQLEPRAVVDWRAAVDVDLPTRPHRLPDAIQTAAVRLCSSLGLTFGALDFAIDKTGEYVFFEVNPNGQWAWLELAAGVPISRKIASFLRGC